MTTLETVLGVFFCSAAFLALLALVGWVLWPPLPVETKPTPESQ